MVSEVQKEFADAYCIFGQNEESKYEKEFKKIS